ncbi:MAG: 6-phosphogluconolactonase, partial [Hoeflea sp.]|nr:6-phosphogluconolactonase [Hoeflea sp.]
MKATEAPPVRLTVFDSGAELAAALARRIAGTLTLAIAARGLATLAVSGGSTPKVFFAALSKEDIDWDKVTVTLVDERMAPPGDDRSNQRLVSLNLLQNHATAAK